MRTRVQIKPELLRWACERTGHAPEAFEARFKHLPGWLRGEQAPTLKQLELFAKATSTPIGYLFLSAPPEERLPIPDFRTMGNRGPRRPSPDLLETIYLCEQRQEWYREFARSNGEGPVPFVGSAKTDQDIVSTAARLRLELGFDLEARRKMPTWADALRSFIGQADSAGVLVMCSGVVLNNTRRRLDPEEFRGFALADPLAPLVFINGADTKAAQMFTLAHELAHLWLGQSAVSDSELSSVSSNTVERWCNQVAAEVLVPLEVLKAEYDRDGELGEEMSRLARRFKVSTLVILRRIFDVGGLTREQFSQEYERERARLQSHSRGSGGDFYLTEAARVSKRFARALITSTFEGQTLYRDAYRMLGITKAATFDNLAHSLGVS